MFQSLYKVIMCDPSCLWYSIHALVYLRKDLSVMRLVLDILCNNEFRWDHGYMDHYIFYSIHAIIEVEVFDFHAHVSVFYVGDDAVYVHFYCS